jgi:hypothetical protein
MAICGNGILHYENDSHELMNSLGLQHTMWSITAKLDTTLVLIHCGNVARPHFQPDNIKGEVTSGWGGVSEKTKHKNCINHLWCSHRCCSHHHKTFLLIELCHIVVPCILKEGNVALTTLVCSDNILLQYDEEHQKCSNHSAWYVKQMALLWTDTDALLILVIFKSNGPHSWTHEPCH